jgi:hypothetical protein
MMEEPVSIEFSQKKSNKNKKAIEIDLDEQNEEFISEAREKVLAKLDVLEKRIWPKTLKDLLTFIQKHSEVCLYEVFLSVLTR